MRKLSAMTLGCPEWTLDDVCSRLPKLGYAGVDFRGLRGEVDIAKTPEFTVDRAASVRRVQESGLAVSCLSSSIQVCNPDREAENLDDARRYADLALELGAPAVRVFGGSGSLEQGVRCLSAILELPGADQTKWLLETHDAWIEPARALRLIDHADHPALAVAWDAGHTLRFTDESPEGTAERLKGRIGGTHLKDAIRGADGEWTYVLPGTGQLPLARVVQALDAQGWDGWLTFEHEKRWIPALEEPEVAFPAFIRWIETMVR